MFAIAALPGVFLVDTLPFCAFSRLARDTVLQKARF